MVKLTTGVGGRGTSMSMERKPHPNSHFELGHMRIERANDGSFVINHRMRLKKKHEGKGDEYSGGYREEETHTAGDTKELMAHVKKHFGGKMNVPAAGAPVGAEPDADDE